MASPSPADERSATTQASLSLAVGEREAQVGLPGSVSFSELFDSEPVCIERQEVGVMLERARDELAAIQELWPRFERLVGLRGRKMFALVDGAAGEYSACTPVLGGDDPAALGLEVGVLPGGAYLRARLVGEPPALYERIGPAMRALATFARADRTRPEVEYYRRRDQVELWLPIDTPADAASATD